MQRGLTEMVFILDRSGSMSGMERDTIGGYNSTIEKQRELPGDALVSTVLFDDNREVLHNRIPIRHIPKLTEHEYYARGSTALIDAMGYAIHHIGNIHKHNARNGKVPEKTIFVITTDGYENSSTRYSAEQVRKMVKRQKEKYGWEFIFLGANIDAVETARQYGIDEDRAANFVNDKEGVHKMQVAQCCLMESIRFNKVMDGDCNWKQEIEQDVRKRGNRRA